MSNVYNVASLSAGERPVNQGDAYYSRQDTTNDSGYIYRYYDVGTAISADGYTARCYGGRNSGYSRYYSVVQCFDAEGNLTFWKYADFNSRYDSTKPYDVCVDDQYVYLVHGYYEYPVTTVKDRVYMTCFDRDTGAVQWNRIYEDMRINTNNAVGHRLDNGADGELVMAGKFSRTSANGGYVARISKTDGTVIASKRTSDQYTEPSECVGIKYLDGNIFFGLGYSAWSVSNDLTTINNLSRAGTPNGFAVGPTLSAWLTGSYLIVMDHSFTRQWGVSMSGIPSDITDVFIDDDDSVYLTYNNSSKVTKWDSSGTVVWQRSLGSPWFGPNQYAVGSRVNGSFFTIPRYNATNLKDGIHKLNIDGSGTGTYGDFTYSSTTQAFSTNTTTMTPETGGVLNGDIGGSASASVTWIDQGGTRTETVYTIV